MCNLCTCDLSYYRNHGIMEWYKKYGLKYKDQYFEMYNRLIKAPDGQSLKELDRQYNDDLSKS